jgi:hypothetical protein
LGPGVQYEDKKAEFDADFESVEKLRKILCDKIINEKVTEKWIFLLLFCTIVFRIEHFLSDVFEKFFIGI